MTRIGTGKPFVWCHGAMMVVAQDAVGVTGGSPRPHLEKGRLPRVQEEKEEPEKKSSRGRERH